MSADADLARRWALRQGRGPSLLPADAVRHLGGTPPARFGNYWYWAGLPKFFDCHLLAYTSEDEAFAALGAVLRRVFELAPQP